MPTKAQNEVYRKYGLRKSDVWRALSNVQETLSLGTNRAYNYVLTWHDLSPMHVAIASLIHLSKVWRAYQGCDPDA